MPIELPLTSLVGLNTAVQALLLLAVEPRLGGVVFAAPAGTGKSSLARGFAALLDGGRWTVDGADCPPSTVHRSLSITELPASADEEALLGGLDMEATLRTGRRVARQGLLARAHNGAIYADQVNLLSDAAANALLGALDSGIVRLEREGLSTQAPAHFILLASYDPSEGQPRRHLLDRLGLWVALPAHSDAQTRAEVVRRNLDGGRWMLDGGKLQSSTVHRPPSNADDIELLRNLVTTARATLPEVRIDDQQVAQLAAAALAFGVEGHRADAFAVYAACAAAALGLRDEVEPADLELAVQLVIMPRATRMPETAADEQGSGGRDQGSEDAAQTPENQEQKTENQEQTTESVEDTQSTTDNQQQTTNNGQFPEEQVFAALMTELPAELEQLPFKALRRGKAGSRGSTSGTRGRHIRSTPGDVRRQRVDIPATLRAAAPWQSLRTKNQEPKTEKTLGSRFLVLGSDLRVKQFKSKAGALFLFAVDASGSMALHRMRQAKGAVHALLQRAYVHRDRVALLAFRGEAAELLLPPSQSVELARRALDTLPTGGGTPLAAALLAAIEVAKQARGRGIMQTVLVLLTDGRANVGLKSGREGVGEELQTLGRSVAASGIHTLVVDTQRSYLSRGEARKLAGWLGGQYVYLPNAQGGEIGSLAYDAVERS